MFIPWEAMYRDGEQQISERSTTLPDGSVITHKSHAKADKWEQYYITQDVYEKINEGKVIAREEESMHLIWYFLHEFELVLEKHGFKEITRIQKIINQEELIVYVADK